MSVQKQDHDSTKVCVVGVSGVGKSTLWEKLLRREPARWIFLFDHKDGDLSRRFKVKACFDGDDLDEAAERGGVIIFNPAKLYPGKPEEGFSWFCDYVWAVKSVLRGLKILGTDELDALVDARSEPESLCKILDQGRTFQLDCFFIAQSMNGIHNQVRKQLTEIFAMLQGDEVGCDYLKSKGFAVSELLSLKNGQFIYKNLRTGQNQRGGKAFAPKSSARDLRGL